MNYAAMTCVALKALCKEHALKGYSKLRKQELIDMLQAFVAPVPMPSPETLKEKRTRSKAKSNEDNDIEAIIKMLNDPKSTDGNKIRDEFYKKFGKRILSARRCDPTLKGKKAGSRSAHYDFQIQTEDGFFNVEHKGSQTFKEINPSLPPWTPGVQFYNGPGKNWYIGKLYAEEWYKMYVGSGLLKKRYKLTSPIPTLEEWMKNDGLHQGSPKTAFGKELKIAYHKISPGKGLIAERNVFADEFITKCTDDDCEKLKEEVMPIIKEAFADKHYWLQIWGNIDTGKFNFAWCDQIIINEIRKIEIIKNSDIEFKIHSDCKFNLRGIIRFGNGAGFSNIRIDLK